MLLVESAFFICHPICLCYCLTAISISSELYAIQWEWEIRFENYIISMNFEYCNVLTLEWIKLMWLPHGSCIPRHGLLYVMFLISFPHNNCSALCLKILYILNVGSLQPPEKNPDSLYDQFEWCTSVMLFRFGPIYMTSSFVHMGESDPLELIWQYVI
jgi:hypothetical protein